jgi:hypothetical protein
MGDKVREGKEPDAKLIMDETVPEEIGKEVHRLWRKTELLKNLLYWQVGERFDAHEYVMGVRTLRRVIRGQRKY